MKRLTLWSARRVGAAITIDATDVKGKPVKVTGIDRIVGRLGMNPVATGKDGSRYELA